MKSWVYYLPIKNSVKNAMTCTVILLINLYLSLHNSDINRYIDVKTKNSCFISFYETIISHF